MFQGQEAINSLYTINKAHKGRESERKCKGLLVLIQPSQDLAATSLK